MRAVFIPLVLVIAVASAGFSQTYTSGEWTYTLNASNEATIIGYSGSGGPVTIPSNLDGMPVKRLGNGFPPIFGSGNTAVTSFSIPNSVTSIGQYAFAACIGLTNVIIPDSVKFIGDYAFSGCSGLTNLMMGDGITHIGRYAFYQTALTNIVLGRSVVCIGAYAFNGPNGEGPYDITIPNTVAFVGPEAFLRGADVKVDDTALGSNAQLANALASNELFVSSLANNIVAALPNNYGIATKSDLGTAVSNAISQTVSQVQANPNEYSLFSADQHAANYSSGVTAGTSLVTANPASYNLYTSNSIMDLRMGGAMVQKQGNNAVVTFQPQTTTDLTQPFTNNGTPITNTIPMPGNKGFLRIQAR